MSPDRFEDTSLRHGQHDARRQDQDQDSARRRAGRLKLAGMFALCLLPVLASYFFYYVMPPSGRANYGALVEPQVDWPVRNAPAMRTLDGAPFDFAALRGKWVLLAIDSAACEPRCAEKLYMIRQQRAMLAKDRDRVERLWLVVDDATVDPRLIAAYEGMHIARVSAADLERFIPVDRGAPAGEAGLAAHIFIVDPLGHIMMRYPRKPDPDGMKKDLARLLKASRIG